MATFTPPIIKDIPPVLVDSTPAQRSLYRHMDNVKRYINVFLLSDNSVVQDTAGGTDRLGNPIANTNTNLPYPWDYNYPNEPYSTAYYFDYANNVMVVDTKAHTVWITKLYGAGPQWVSTAEAAILTAAGYAGCLS